MVQRRKYRHENERRRSLYASGEDSLKMRALFLACDNTHFNFSEAALLEKLVQLDFAKSEPVVSI